MTSTVITPDDKLNYAAYLLADNNGVSIQVAKYTDTTRMHLAENRDYGRCSLVKALKAVLDRVEVENTIFTKIGYPLRQEREMINSIAMREAVINAIVHNDYSYGAVPKIEFFSDRVEVTAMGGLPFGVEEVDFFSGGSVPRNKEIMRVFRDLEIVEHLGSGILRIVKAYSKEVFDIRKSFVRVVLPYAEPIDGATPQVTPQVLRLLQRMEGDMTRAEMMGALYLKDRMHFSRDYIAPALEMELVEMSIPDKPNSRLQKYRLTDRGREVLKKESAHG